MSAAESNRVRATFRDRKTASANIFHRYIRREPPNPDPEALKRDKPSCFLHAVSGRIVPTGGHSAVDDDGPRDEADRLSADSQAPAGTVGAHVRTHTPTRGADRYMFLLALSTRDVGLGIG